MKTAVRLLVHGRVQGVGFRAFVVREAKQLGLDGWARNLRDGTVEILIAGDRETVRLLVERCRCGPSHAVVTGIGEYPAVRSDMPDASGFYLRSDG